MANRILIAGGSGLVGIAALKLFASLPDWDVLVLSRRRPPTLFNARFVPADLMDENACAELADQLRGLTHVVYTALHERPELIAGWRHEAQIRTNDRMLRNLFAAVEKAAPDLTHVTLLQGTKAYGVHVRPIAIPAREDRDEVREEPNFYWLQEEFLKERQKNQSWHWTILRPQIIFGESFGSAMNLIPAIGTYAALLKEDGRPLFYPGGTPNLMEAVDADSRGRPMLRPHTTRRSISRMAMCSCGEAYGPLSPMPWACSPAAMRRSPWRAKCQSAHKTGSVSERNISSVLPRSMTS